LKNELPVFGKEASVMAVHALTMVSEDLDDPALVDASVPASLDHQFEFDLQSRQTSNTLLDLDEARLGDTVCRRAGLMRIVLEYQQRANGIDIEAQFASMPDERKAAEVGSRITALVTLTSIWRHKQADAFVVADGRHFDAALTGRISDRDFFHHLPLHL
jgi:hypothetical protein